MECRSLCGLCQAMAKDKDIEDELTALLEKYFALPYFEFRYDEEMQ